MDFPVKEVIGGAVTLAVALLGFYQWKRTKRSGRFLEDREAAYKAIWEALEEVHLCVRAEKFSATAFEEQARKANALMMKHGLHLSQEDARRAADYIQALGSLGVVLGQVAADHPSRREFHRTSPMPAMPEELVPAYSRMTQAREALIGSFRKSVGAGQI